ncbi:hypothetical protein F5Y08DRAFT_354917 [Xylaria arbuscula]|nr:hypothetical protein F5Y08DRAFT_354917 [Xylaria arbuscula]
MGTLPVVYDGVRQPELDIVSIPGLPTLQPQYRLKDHNQWLREVLAHQIPRARIMAFQYDFGKGAKGASWLELLNHVDKLLFALVHRRENAESRPLLFVCYSFGAFILKKALLIAKERLDFNQILERTGGIVFLGCLNDENHPELKEVCLNCAAVEFGTTQRHDVVGSLRKSEDWNIIKEVMESFRSLRCPFPVRILYELKHTTINDRLAWMKKGGKGRNLCSEQISALGWNDERLIGVEQSHDGMVMYPPRDDTEGFFDTFMDTLSEIVDKASPQATDIFRMNVHQSPEGYGSWVFTSEFGSTTNVTLDTTFSPSSTPTAIPSNSLSAVKLPCFIIQPYEENPNFVGREDILEEIHKELNPYNHNGEKQKIFALTGLGGMGKTQTAVSYAFRHRDDFKIILLAHADAQTKLAESYVFLSTALGLGDSLIPVQAKENLKGFLKTQHVPWLMIFDNADGVDNKALLDEFWPDGDTGAVLITTRDQTLLSHYHGLCLDELDEKSAVNLLSNLTNMSRARMSDEFLVAENEAARKIVEKIGYLPLAISQAASLILEDGCSMSEFLEAYGLRELISDCEDVRFVSDDATYKYSLRTVWNMSYDPLTGDQQKLIKLMSFLDPDRVQLQVLRDAASNMTDSSLDFISTPYKLNKCKSGLLKSTLAAQSQDKQELRIHRLVQASCQLRMNLQERQEMYRTAVKLIRAVWPIPPRHAVHNPSLWEKQRALLRHAQRLATLYEESYQAGVSVVSEEVVDWEFASMLYEAGWFCYESGLLESVADLLRPAERYCLQHLTQPGGNRILADIYGGLGSLDTESNQFQGAFNNFQNHHKYVQLALEAGELERPSIWEVFALGRLGNGYHGLHLYSDAESYYRKCLAAWEELPGDRKIFTTHLATSAGCKVGWKRLKPLTAMAMYSLGNILIGFASQLTLDGFKEKAEAKFSEAMELHGKVLHLWTITLGARHHKTADATHKVGWHLHRINEYDKALIMFRRALDIYSEQPNLYKNEIARTKYKMGCVFQDSGDQPAGLRLIQDAEHLRQEIIPPEDWEPARGEKDFDYIVQFWTR